MPDVNEVPSDTYITRLQNAIRSLNGCESGYVETITVSEPFHSFQRNKLWQGDVLVFEIHGHPEAKRAYAWSHTLDDGQTRHIVVLEIPPITSPQTAVQAAIAAQIVQGIIH